MTDASTGQRYRDVRYEFNAPMWHAFPGPEEDGDGTRDSDTVSQGYFNDPKATAALLTPNARQNVVTVRRRSGPNGRASGLISPQPIKAAKRLRMEVADENMPPTAAAGGAAKKQKASNIRTSWGGATGRRAQPSSTQAAGGKSGSHPAPWPPPPRRDALRQIGSPRSRAAVAAGATGAAPAQPAAAAAAAQSTSGGRTRSKGCAGPAPTAPPAPAGACTPAAADHNIPDGGSSSAQQPGHTEQQQPVPEQQLSPAQAAPQPEQRSLGTPRGAAQQQHAATGQLTPVAEHGEARHFTRSAAKARSPEGTSPAAMAPEPLAAEGPNTTIAAAAPMSGRKRSLRSNSGSPAAATAVPGTLPAAPEAAGATGPVAAAAAAQQSEDPCQAAKRRARPRKSGLHAGLPARVPMAEADSSATGDLSASAVFVGATAALLSAAAALQAPEQAAAGTGALSTVPEIASEMEQQAPTPAVLPASGSAVQSETTAPQAAAEAEQAAASSEPGGTVAPAEWKAKPVAQQLHRRSSTRHKGLTIPQSPMLRSKLRFRPPNPDLTTEELRIQQSRAEAEEAARLRAANAAAAVRVLRAMPRLPPRRVRPLTVGHTPPLRTARRPRTHGMATRSQPAEPTVAELLAAFEAGRGVLRLTGLVAATAGGATGPPRLTRPESPELHTNARLRGPRFMSTEESELAAMAAQPPFAAHPVGHAVAEGSGRRGLPPVPHRPPTEFAPFHLSTSNTPALPPPPQDPPFVFAARAAPATTQQPAAVARPPRAPVTQPRPFALSTDARAPRRAAAAAAQQAAHEPHSAASRTTTKQGRHRRSSASAGPQPPTCPASPRLSLTARAADRARFDSEAARRAQQAEEEQLAAATARAEREAAELAAYRKTLEFKARPVPSGDVGGGGRGHAPHPPLTLSQSPCLNTRSRAAARGL